MRDALTDDLTFEAQDLMRLTRQDLWFGRCRLLRGFGSDPANDPPMPKDWMRTPAQPRSRIPA